jgi:hypothetical protein
MSKTLTWSNSFDGALSRRQTVSKYSVPSPYLTWVSYGLLAMNAVVLLSYFFGVNSAASQGYEMRKIQTSINQLSEENKKLLIKASEQTSMAQLQIEISNSTFVPVQSALYIQQQHLTKQ